MELSNQCVVSVLVPSEYFPGYSSDQQRRRAEAFNAGVQQRAFFDEGVISDDELRRGLRMHVIVTNVTDKLSMKERFELLDAAHKGAGLKQ